MERPNSASASSRLYASLDGRPSTWLQYIVRASARTRTQHRGTRTRTRSDFLSQSGPLVVELPRTALRSTISIAAGQTAVEYEYEYRFTEYRFAEYEYDEIRCEARMLTISQPEHETQRKSKTVDRGLGCIVLFVDHCSGPSFQKQSSR